MTHQAWAAEYKAILKSHDVDRLREFLARTRELARDSVDDWHVNQVSGMLGDRLNELGKSAEAESVHLERIEEDEEQIRFYESSAGHKLAELAFWQFENGDHRALETAKKAARYLARSGECSLTFEKLLSQ